MTLKNSADRWIGPGNEADRMALATQMSPITYVRPGLPPTFIVHGDADPAVPYEQSTSLQQALTNVRVPVQLHTVPGGQHGKFSPEQSRAVGASLQQFLATQGLLPKSAKQ